MPLCKPNKTLLDSYTHTHTTFFVSSVDQIKEILHQLITLETCGSFKTKQIYKIIMIVHNLINWVIIDILLLEYDHVV